MTIDFNKIKELREIAERQVTNAEKYSEAREKAGKAESSLKLILTANLKKIRSEKPNVGIDMAILMLCEENETAKDLLKEWTEQEAIYKGLERLIEATASILIFEQSLMKFQGSGERFVV